MAATEDQHPRDLYRPMARREAILEQLGYLLIEIEELTSLFAGISPELLRARPPDGPSILEAFVEIGRADRLAQAQLERAADVPAESAPQPIEPEIVLGYVRSGRQQLLAALRPIQAPAWERPLDEDGEPGQTPLELAHEIIQRDLAMLRSIGDVLRVGRLSY
jgi:hypothetical protein